MPQPDPMAERLPTLRQRFRHQAWRTRQSLWRVVAGQAGRRELGQRGEQLALRFLASSGYAIERTNVRFPVGEIDIVAREGRVLCFVEVRSASSSAWGGALTSITDRKRRRLIRAAQWSLARLRALPPEIRFDVVAIEWSDPPKIDLIRGAFSADDR